MNSRTKLATLVVAFIICSGVLAIGGPANRIPAGRGADGNAVYASKCASCHGKDGRGLPIWRAKGQPDFTNAAWQKSRTDAQLIASTKEGKGKMPAFKGKLSDEDISAVVARVRAFAKK